MCFVHICILKARTIHNCLRHSNCPFNNISSNWFMQKLSSLSSTSKKLISRKFLQKINGITIRNCILQNWQEESPTILFAKITWNQHWYILYAQCGKVHLNAIAIFCEKLEIFFVKPKQHRYMLYLLSKTTFENWK